MTETEVKAALLPRRAWTLKPTPVKSPLRLLLVALGVGLGADLLFWGKSPGLSVLLFVGLLLVGLFGLTRLERVRLAWRNAWLIGPILFFAAMVMLRANPTLTLLNLLYVMVLICLLLYFYAADNLAKLGMPGYLSVIGLALKSMLLRPTPIVVERWEVVSTYRRHFRLFGSLLRGLIIAVPILLVFVFLLSSADSIFEGYVNKVLRLKFADHIPDYFMQLVFVLVVAWSVSGGFLLALGRPREKAAKPSENLPGTILPGRLVGFTECLTVLVLVDLLFVVFAWIQFTYLFSGQAERSMNYVDYREYVRRGFGELLVASVLTMSLILGLRWATRHQQVGQERIFKLLTTLMVGLAAVMLLSAFQRMVTWERIEYYINTQTRIYVRAFILWLGLTFGWLLVSIWFRPARFAIGLFVAGLGFMATVNLLNPDVDVAEYNLTRYQSGSNAYLSYRYLWELSEDAVPTLVKTFEGATGPVKEELRRYLADRLSMLEYRRDWQEWPSFNFARNEAYNLLYDLRQAGQIEDYRHPSTATGQPINKKQLLQ